MRIDDLLVHRVSNGRSGAAFLGQNGVALGWAEALWRADAFAGALRRAGGRPGDRVLLVCDNEPAAVVALFGTLRAGLVAVPMDPQVPAGRLRFIVDDCRPVVAFATAAGQAALDGLGVPRLDPGAAAGGDFPASPRGGWAGSDDAEALALLIYTSGSIQGPKAVMAPHGSVLFAVRAINQVLGQSSHDTLLDALPFAFDYGLYQIFLALEAGARLVLVPSSHPPLGLPGLLGRHQVTGLPLTPTLLSLLVRSRLLERVALPHLRYVTSTGDVLAPALVRALRDILPGITVFPMYGLTECKRVSILAPDAHEDAHEGAHEGTHVGAHEGSVGLPLPGTDVEIVDAEGRPVPPGDVGELIVRGPHVMAGYWNAPTETAATFGRDVEGRRFLRTGDRFHRDGKGYLYFHGRSQDFVKSGGLRLGLREIEAGLAGVPGVADVVAIGVPHVELGTEVVAVVVPLGEEQTVRAACRAAWPPPYGPRRYVFRPTLPRTANGKRDRRLLEAELAATPPSSEET